MMHLNINLGDTSRLPVGLPEPPGPPGAFHKVEHRLDRPGKRGWAHRMSISLVPCTAYLGQGVARVLLSEKGILE